jgi:hypothetical protein
MTSLQEHGLGGPEENNVCPLPDLQIRVSRPGMPSFSLVANIYLSHSRYNTMESHNTRFHELPGDGSCS